MTKSELIARLAQRYPQLVAKDAEYAVKMILDAMTQALLAGDRIEIRGFGSFGLNYRPPRVGRNPKSGEKVHVPALQGRQGAARAGGFHPGRAVLPVAGAAHAHLSVTRRPERRCAASGAWAWH